MDDRTAEYDDWRWQRVSEEWGIKAEEQAECSVCGEPVLFSQGRLRHSIPAIKRPAAPFGSEAYDLEQARWGITLGEWLIRTGHPAVLG